MLNAHQILELKHHADKKQKMIYEVFKKKIVNDPQRESILHRFNSITNNILPLMEVYVKNILSSNEFEYMLAMFNDISNKCIQAFIDGMTLDEADWAYSISSGHPSTLEKTFYLITQGYSKEQIETFAEVHFELQMCDDNLGWYTTNLYDVVIGYPNISVKEIKCCADLIRRKRILYTNKNLFVTLLKMGIDTSELELFFYEIDTWEHKDDEIIEAFLDVKMLYGN